MTQCRYGIFILAFILVKPRNLLPHFWRNAVSILRAEIESMFQGTHVPEPSVPQSTIGYWKINLLSKVLSLDP